MANLSIWRSREPYENPQKRSKLLAEQLKQGRLSLILGAGTSIEFGFPHWNQLIEICFVKRKLTYRLTTASAEEKAEDLLQRGFGGSEAKLARHVHKCLYSGTKLGFNDLRQSNLLAAIGALTMASGRGSVSKVVNFNYDESLERFLRFYGYRVLSVSRLPAWSTRKDVVVYHPHGLLPVNWQTGTHPDSRPRIVLTKGQFDRFFTSESELWHNLLIDILASHTCLLIGVSGYDRTLGRALEKVKDYHASNAHGALFWGFRFGRKRDGGQNAEWWERRGIFPIWVRKYSDIPKALFEICQTAAE